MAPFRQQATAVSSMKRNALDQLEKAENILADFEIRLEEKKKDAKYLLEQPLPSEEEFKQYVARLKAKSVIYKRCKAELSGIKAENGVLNRTVEILNLQMNQMLLTYEKQPNMEILLPENFTMENSSKINAELHQSVTSLQMQLKPLLSELKQMREEFKKLEERYENLTKDYNSGATSENTTFSLAQEVTSLKEKVKENLQKTKEMRENISKIKKMEERIQQEMKQYTAGDSSRTIKDELNEAIELEEKKLKIFKEEEKQITESMTSKEYQTQQWRAVTSILECKLQCAEDNKKRDGIVVRGEGAETLILQ